MVGDKLPLAVNETAKVASAVTVSNVLGYCASQIGYTASFSGVSSDFTTLLPPHTPKWVLFGFVYTGMVIPIICIQLFGAACQLAAYSIPSWKAGGEIGAANLLFAMTGQSGPAKFIMVLFCLSVVANVASTIYSCGLSGQVVFPFLLVIPRYFLAVVVIAIVLPVAMLGSDRFFEILLNFLSVLGYWTAIYLAPALIEPLVFRAPPNRTTYPVAIWNQIGKLPIGLGFIASACAVGGGPRRTDPRASPSPPLACLRRGGMAGFRAGSLAARESFVRCDGWLTPGETSGLRLRLLAVRLCICLRGTSSASTLGDRFG